DDVGARPSPEMGARADGPLRPGIRVSPSTHQESGRRASFAVIAPLQQSVALSGPTPPRRSVFAPAALASSFHRRPHREGDFNHAVVTFPHSVSAAAATGRPWAAPAFGPARIAVPPRSG